MSVKLVYGIDLYSKILHVDEVARGKDCNCVCPECGTELIARKGEKNQNHFAHSNGRECKHAPETGLHKLAKSIVKDNQQIYLDSEIIFQYSDSELEKQFESFIPDVTIWNTEEKVFVELVVTNDVSYEKEEKLKKTGFKTLVIDLSWVARDINKIELEKEVLANSEIRRIIQKEKIKESLAKNDNSENKKSSNFRIDWVMIFVVGAFFWFFFGKRKKDKLYTDKRFSKLKSTRKRKRKMKFGT